MVMRARRLSLFGSIRRSMSWSCPLIPSVCSEVKDKVGTPDIFSVSGFYAENNGDIYLHSKILAVKRYISSHAWGSGAATTSGKPKMSPVSDDCREYEASTAGPMGVSAPEGASGPGLSRTL
jgi:hypothetical protein